MKTRSTSKAAFFNLRILVGFALCSVGVLLGLAGLSKSVTATAVTTPHSTKWYVNGVTGSDSNDCKSPTTACKTIGHAISLAGSGDSISVAAATYNENLTIGINLKITGADPSTTIIDGGGAGGVILIPSGVQVTLSRFTIRNGVTHTGGGVSNQGALAIVDCTVTGNTATVYLFQFGGDGGGIFNSGTLTIKNSTVSFNQALSPPEGSAYGKGDRSQVMIDSYGGGIVNDTGTITITNSTIAGNGASRGGGISNGLLSNSGTLSLNNSTISGNGSTFGGGIYDPFGGAVLQNTIVANNNAGGNCSGGVTSNGYNLSSDNTCGFHNTGDLNNTDPMLGPLQDNGGPTDTQALLTGSPAIDAGNPGGCTDSNGRLLKTDQRHMPRPDHEDTGGCDMGAYESQSD